MDERVYGLYSFLKNEYLREAGMRVQKVRPAHFPLLLVVCMEPRIELPV